MKAPRTFPLLADFPFFILLALVQFLSFSAESASEIGETAGVVFDVAKFGAVADGRTDCGPAFRNAVAAAVAAGPGSVVQVGNGIWRLLPEGDDKVCVPVSQASRLTIRGEPGKTELLIGEPGSSAFAFKECEETTVRGFIIDYDPLPFTQGKIVAIDRETGTFDLKIDSGYADFRAPMFEQTQSFGMLMDPKTRRLKRGVPDFVSMSNVYADREKGVWRLAPMPEDKTKLRFAEAGDLFVKLARFNSSIFWLENSRACAVEDIVVYSSPASSVTSTACDTLRVSGLRVHIRPGTDRLISTDADGVHCQQNLRGPVIEECSFEGMADDAINIYAPAVIVRKIVSPFRILVSGYAGTIQAGDQLQAIAPQTGIVRGITILTHIEPSGNTPDKLWTLEFSQPIEGLQAGEDFKSADTLYNLTRCGAGYVIRNNKFLHFRGRGALLRAGEGVVEDNTFIGPSSRSIVLANEPDWPEGPMPWQVTIRRNTFQGGGYEAAVNVLGYRLGHRPAEGRSLRGILIENNRFINPEGPAMFLQSARDVVIRSNRIDLQSDIAPARRAEPLVSVRNSEGVLIENLAIQGQDPTGTAAIHIDELTKKGAEGVQIANLHVSPSQAIPTIADDRE